MEFTNVLTVPGTFTWHVHHGNRITSQHRPAQATNPDGCNDNGCLPECLQGGVFPRSGVGHVQWRQLCCLCWRQSLNRLHNSWVHLTTVFQLHSSKFCSASSRCVSYSTAVSYTTVYESMSKATICFLYVKELQMASIDRGNMADCRTRSNTLALQTEFISAEMLRLQNANCGSTTTRAKWDL